MALPAMDAGGSVTAEEPAPVAKEVESEVVTELEEPELQEGKMLVEVASASPRPPPPPHENEAGGEEGEDEGEDEGDAQQDDDDDDEGSSDHSEGEVSVAPTEEFEYGSD
eukprot:scaffold107753_cov36-Phaeocystis_antarctica.AAC.1